MKDLQVLRGELDAVDREMVALFEKRMEIAQQVARYKLQNGLPVLDAGREQQVLASRRQMLTDDSLGDAAETLFRHLMALSREVQEKILREATQ